MEANQQRHWNEQRFGMTGFICFTPGHDKHLDPKLLKSAMEQVDKVNPWISHYVGGGQAPSIGYMSEAIMKEKTEWTSRDYTIEIRPPFHLMADQFYAY